VFDETIHKSTKKQWFWQILANEIAFFYNESGNDGII
jgi:hypothetical protein